MSDKTLVRRLNSIIEITKTPTSVLYTEIARFTKGIWYQISDGGKEIEACLPDQSAIYSRVSKDDWSFNEKCHGCPIYLMCVVKSKEKK